MNSYSVSGSCPVPSAWDAPAAERSGTRAAALAVVLALVLAGCASTGPAAGTAAQRERRLVPLVDHHQHLMSERMIPPPPASPPFVQLPAELAAVLEARNQVNATRELGEVFTADALILHPWSGVWLQRDAGVSAVTGFYGRTARFFANGYSLSDSLAAITGVIRGGDYTKDGLAFTMTLARDTAGRWRISSEGARQVAPRDLATAVTADQLIQAMDAVGIQKAVVLSVAYWLGSRNNDKPDAYERTRAENDWTAAEAARYPDRLVAFCGIAPLRDHAEAEIRRCATELRVRGIKMHFQNNGVNLHDAAHVARVRRVFEVANELGLAIVVHSRTPRDFEAYDRDEAEIILNQILPAAPDVTVQIAHLWGGNEISEGALAAFADAVSSGDRRVRNLYFDLTEVEAGTLGSDANRALVAKYARQIGMDRLLYGSDMTARPDLPPSTLGWSRIVNSIPLTRAEFADIADNVAPYLR